MGKFTRPDGTVIEIRGYTRPGNGAAKSAPSAAVRPAASRSASAGRELAGLKQSAADLAGEAAALREERAAALEDQARSWRERAKAGRVTGLDPGVREHLLIKAAEAEQAAEELRGNPTSANHEAAAEEYRQRALKADSAEQRRYFYAKQREYLARAALARGETASAGAGG